MSATLAPADVGVLALQLALVGAVIDAARRLAGALFPGRSVENPQGTRAGRTERLLFAAVLALAFAVAIAQGLGFAAALLPLPIAAAIALLWLVVRLLTRGEPGPSGPPAGPKVLRSVARLACLVVGALVGGALAARALLRVPTEWDGLTYHLFYAAHYLQEARIVPVELGQPHDMVSLFPGNGELVHALLMAIVRSDLLVALGMVTCWALFGLALAGLARRLGLAPVPAAATGLLGATLPALARSAASSYVEPLLNFALVALLLAVHRALTEPAWLRAAAALGGLAAGLAVGTKYVALPVVIVAFLALASSLALSGPRRRAAQALGLFVGGVFLIGGAWYLRNWLATGNPLFPAPFLGLPHLERPGIVWEGSHLLARWRDLAARDLLGDALFGLPPGRQASTALGFATLLALPFAALTLALTLRDAVRRWRDGSREIPATVAALLVPAAWVAMVVTYLHLPFWENDGWFRSGVRFAVPAAALAIMLALSALERLRLPPPVPGWIGVLAAAVALGQAAQAGVFAALPGLARGLLLLTPPLALALLLARWRVRARAPRAVLRAAAFALAVVVFLLAWILREAKRERLWTAPDFVGGDFARAALATGRAVPGPATIAWATSSHSEFLYVFLGRRLERRVITLPLHAGPRAAWAYRDGNPRRGADRAYWLSALAEARPDVLVVSRWQAFEARWPLEDGWAREEGFERVVDHPEFRAYRIPAARVWEPTSSGTAKVK